MKRDLFNLMDYFVLDRVFAPGINSFRQSLGLSSVKKIFDRWTHSPQLNLGLFPDWYAPPQPDWPAQARLTGFVYFDKLGNNQVFSPELQEFLDIGKSPVIFTPGTAMQHGEQFFADCVVASRMLGRRGILLTQHTEQLPTSLPDKPVQVLFWAFCDSAREVRMYWWIEEFIHQDHMLHKVNTTIECALNEAEIEMPIPIYDLKLKNEDT